MNGLEALRHSEHMNEDEAGQHAEQLHQDLALLQHQQRNPIDPHAESLEWCEDCGNEIPELRRQALPGVTVCIDCAREAERKDRVYR
jgi:phage/conjugal plasmid C-4 type zinc finger TraR family protein